MISFDSFLSHLFTQGMSPNSSTAVAPDAGLNLLTAEAPEEIAPDKILQLGLGFWGSKTLFSAVELGIFTELARIRSTPSRCART